MMRELDRRAVVAEDLLATDPEAAISQLLNLYLEVLEMIGEHTIANRIELIFVESPSPALLDMLESRSKAIVSAAVADRLMQIANEVRRGIARST